MFNHTRTLAFIALTTAALSSAATGQNLFIKGRNPRSLIADLRASAIGDILTIQVREEHKVKNEDRVDRRNTTGFAAALNAYSLGRNDFNQGNLPGIDVSSERSQLGNAKQERDSTVTASVAVIVVDVQPNGNLVVAGTRVVKVDDVTKTLRISGIVRQLDITPANTIQSTQVADARIAITSEGAHKHTVTRGPVATLFDTLIWTAWPF